MNGRLFLILGDQLHPDPHPLLTDFDPADDQLLMVEADPHADGYTDPRADGYANPHRADCHRDPDPHCDRSAHRRSRPAAIHQQTAHADHHAHSNLDIRTDLDPHRDANANANADADAHRHADAALPRRPL